MMPPMNETSLDPYGHADSVGYTDMFTCEQPEGHRDGKMPDNHGQARRDAPQEWGSIFGRS